MGLSPITRGRTFRLFGGLYGLWPDKEEGRDTDFSRVFGSAGREST